MTGRGDDAEGHRNADQVPHLAVGARMEGDADIGIPRHQLRHHVRRAREVALERHPRIALDQAREGLGQELGAGRLDGHDLHVAAPKPVQIVEMCPHLVEIAQDLHGM